ncbi:phosphoenolpyruvate--protein phosphotransferase [bacterium BFN5]|nr:phosphoenolpyruvate--protein phosphotransferase [bacterium BFN5]QJW48978.1 phosphoenolpyruvate--protein phosphotransferase [bacterium BFN5]
MDQKKWQGIGASPGHAAGPIWLLPTVAKALQLQEFEESGQVDSDGQLARLQQAIESTDQALARYEEKVRAEQGEELARIFAAHRLLLSDPGFTGEMQLRIKDRQIRAEKAAKQVADEAIAMLSSLNDPYFRERIVDIQDVAQQLIQNLNTESPAEQQFPATGNWIVVADELTPAQTISLPKDRVLAFIVRKGGKTSHAAILARTYGIPAVVGLTGKWDDLMMTGGVELDGTQGWIRSLSAAEMISLEESALNQGVQAELDNECSQSGDVTLAANIGSPNDVSLIRRFKAQGVGLYRTEFLFMGDVLPTEEEQVNAYLTVIQQCSPAVTVIRTLDIGGDKRAPALQLPIESNPFLGVRALRLCFKNPELLTTQLRAIWRASAAGSTAVMFPMISNYDELMKAKQYLAEAKQSVLSDGYPVGTLQVGMMIEVPAAVWIAPKLAKEVDFFSIGTNDLIQYTLAVDRENHEIADLYQPYHPAVLGMIAQVAKVAKSAGIWTGICGESGGDVLLAPFFAGVGIDELSMSPGVLPHMRRALAGIDRNELERAGVVEQILDCATAAEVVTILQSYSKGGHDYANTGS